MSRALLVLMDPGAPSAATAETLRLALAATASGTVRLVAWTAPPQDHTEVDAYDDVLSEEAATTLEHLRARGVDMTACTDAALHEALREADDVWCCLRRDAPCPRDIVVITDAWLEDTETAALRVEIIEARHIIRARA